MVTDQYRRPLLTRPTWSSSPSPTAEGAEPSKHNVTHRAVLAPQMEPTLVVVAAVTGCIRSVIPIGQSVGMDAVHHAVIVADGVESSTGKFSLGTTSAMMVVSDWAQFLPAGMAAVSVSVVARPRP